MGRASPSIPRAKKPVAIAATPTKKGPTLAGFPGAVKWLLDRTDVERMRPTRAVADLLKLDRMHKLVDLLGDPQKAVRHVHIAGTKGKGSTCEMTASCLEACGYTVGVYTSPHLTDIRERMRINSRQISHADFARIAQRVADAAANLPDLEDDEPTFFELTTAMAFLYFAEEAVDVAVIEVGLGGRLDSTNVITPEVAAITSISLDHTQILGDTVELIAAEKAGIFKPGVPALTVPQKPGVVEVFRDMAARVGCPLQVVGQDIDFSMRFEASPNHGPQARVCLTTARNNYEHLVVPLRGEHQATNCGLALAILDKLTERGFHTPEDKVTRGLAAVRAPGRMELAWPSPRVIVDGAHNTDSVRCLIKAIGANVPYDSMVMIFGCAADKDIDGMLAEVALGADKVVFTRASTNARAADPKDLARRFNEDQGKMAQTADSIAEAFALATRAVNREDLVVVTGSFYLVGEAKKHLAGVAARRANHPPQ
jgi:dihydrofolate synthase/folylpolyglutamate synthase